MKAIFLFAVVAAPSAAEATPPAPPSLLVDEAPKIGFSEVGLFAEVIGLGEAAPDDWDQPAPDLDVAALLPAALGGLLTSIGSLAPPDPTRDSASIAGFQVLHSPLQSDRLLAGAEWRR